VQDRKVSLKSYRKSGFLTAPFLVLIKQMFDDLAHLLAFEFQVREILFGPFMVVGKFSAYFEMLDYAFKWRHESRVNLENHKTTF